MPSHSERRFLPYPPEEIFALVADIESYPEFLPWCVGARIRQRQGQVLVADLRARFGMLRETFTSRVTLAEPERIDVAYLHGPFRHMTTHWRFEPASGGTMIAFGIDCEFRTAVLRGVAGRFFREAAKRMAGAFEDRAHALHGGAPGTCRSLPKGDRRRADA